MRKHLTPSSLPGKAIEEVEKYVYLGKTVSWDGDLMPEIKRSYHFGMGCLQQGPTTSWEAVKASMQWAQRKMLRELCWASPFAIQRHNTWIRQQTGVTDIIDHIRQSKHQWARSCSQASRQQVDHQSNILGSTEMVKTTRKTENKMERWTQSAPGNHLDKIGPRQTSVEAIQGGVPP